MLVGKKKTKIQTAHLNIITLLLVVKTLELVKDGNLDEIKIHLEKIEDADFFNPSTKISILHMLLKSCTKENWKSKKEIVSYILLKIPLLIKHADSYGQTPLHYIASAKFDIPEDEILEKLQEVCIDLLPVNSQCNEKKTPLHYAIESNKGKVTKFLLESGKVIFDQATDLNYLHYLCKYSRNFDSLLALCEASTSDDLSHTWAQAKFNDPTPLYYAVSGKCDEKFLEKLLYQFCSVEDVVEAHYGEMLLTPLMKALYEKQTDNSLCLVKFLIQKTKDKLNLKKTDNLGKTVFHHCIFEGGCEVFAKLCMSLMKYDKDGMKELLLQKCNVDKSPLDVIISNKDIDILCIIEGDIFLSPF